MPKTASLLRSVTGGPDREIGPIGTASRAVGGLIAIVLTIATPVSDVALLSFVGVSMLVAALRGYAGCEVLAIPNAITGRRDQIGCVLYTPIDAAEAKGKAGRPGQPV